MTASQKEKIDALITILPKSDKTMYRKIAEYAIPLGYSPDKIIILETATNFNLKLVFHHNTALVHPHFLVL